MTVPEDPKKAFNAKRLKRMDEARRDGKISTTARLVAQEILWCLNSVSVDAWCSQIWLSKSLNLNIKTIKNAVAEIDGKYFEIIRIRGAVNHYRPIWGEVPAHGRAPGKQEVPEVPTHGRAPTWGQNGLGTGGQNGPGTGGQNGPLSLISTHSNIPERQPPPRAGGGVSSAGTSLPRQAGEEDLRGARDDGAIELKAIRLFDRAGFDGLKTVEALHHIDGGTPRLRLFRLIRCNQLTADDIRTAAFAAEEYNRQVLVRRGQVGAK